VSAEIPDDRFLDRYDRAGARFLRLMLYLVLFGQGVLDWVDGTRLGYDKTGSAMMAGFEPQWHHIYPRNVLKKAGVPDDEIHALANITVLNERTNANKLVGKEPWRYIRQFSISFNVLRLHLIPEPFVEALRNDELLQKRWSVQRYADFLIDRTYAVE
jgi:hypothetical protein